LKAALNYVEGDGKYRWEAPWKLVKPFRDVDATEHPPIPFKALRTTYGSLLALQGVPLQVVASALGHADTRITEKHYAHLVSNYVADTIRANLPTFGDTMSNVKRIKRQ
jgi:integrase